MKNILITAAAVLFAMSSSAQQPYPVSDAAPVEANGLKAGYSIVSESQKEVGNKGDFSRYSINFYVTNTTNEAKIILYKQGFNLLGSTTSANLASFTCTNATGARLTSKEATLQAKPCYVQADVEDKDCTTNKTKTNRRQVQIGYWIKAGETISSKTVMIVPLNTKPDMKVMLSDGTLGSVTNSSLPGNGSNIPIGISFSRIKNFSSNTYLNNQTEAMTVSPIDNQWWSAQWQLIPVSGTNYFLLKNRWKETYLTNDNSTMLTTNSQSVNAMWSMDVVGTSNTYTIKNAANGYVLIVQSGQLKTAQIFGEQAAAKWIIEQ